MLENRLEGLPREIFQVLGDGARFFDQIFHTFRQNGGRYPIYIDFYGLCRC